MNTNVQLDMNRYIKDYEIKDDISEYINNNLLKILINLSKEIGCYNYDSNTCELSKLKKAICIHIEKNHHNRNVSKKQISRLIRPKKHKFSKYAPLYLIAIYEMYTKTSVINWRKMERSCNFAKRKYPEYALNRILESIRNLRDKNNNDPNIIYFFRLLDDVYNLF